MDMKAANGRVSWLSKMRVAALADTVNSALGPSEGDPHAANGGWPESTDGPVRSSVTIAASCFDGAVREGVADAERGHAKTAEGGPDHPDGVKPDEGKVQGDFLAEILPRSFDGLAAEKGLRPRFLQLLAMGAPRVCDTIGRTHRAAALVTLADGAADQGGDTMAAYRNGDSPVRASCMGKNWL